MEEVRYCFVDADDRQALFEEAYARGLLTAILDFPKLKSRDEMAAAARIVCMEMSSRIYAVDSFDKLTYLFGSAWASAYAMVAENFSERQIVNLLTYCKDQADEALISIRGSMPSEELHLNELYADIMRKCPY